MGKTELRFDEALLQKVRAAGLDPQAVAERALEASLKPSQELLDLVELARRQAADPAGAEARAKQWAEENAEAIRQHKQAIARRGVFGDDLRRW